MKNNDTSIEVTSVPSDYKQQRLIAWEHLSFRWMHYTEKDNFHQKVLDRVADIAIDVVKKLHSSKPSLVDIGCGPGVLLGKIGRRKLFVRLAGVDFCPGMLAVARERNIAGDVHVEYCRSDMEDFDAEEREHMTHQFDVATAAFLFDEVGDPEGCFRSAASLLRPGGQLIAATLAPDRERMRYASKLEGFTSVAAGPVLLSKRIVMDGRRAPALYFRIIREPQELIECALTAGLEMIQDKSVSAARLGSRPQGPFLRLLVFRLPA